MNFKKIRKDTLYFIGWLALNACSFVTLILPGFFLYGFAYSLGILGYTFAGKQRRIALESLEIAFGKQKSRQEIEQIARACFIYMSKSAIELLYLMGKPELMRKRVSIVGKEHLDACLARGRGAILVSAHFGNFPLLLGRLSLEGYKAGGIMRPMRDQRTEEFFLAKRRRYQIKTIYATPRNVCVDNTIRALRNNELVFIPLDQHFGTGGVMVDFFGSKAATATGPVIFAQRTKACLLPCFIIRQKDDTHKIVFEPPVEMETGDTAEETVVRNVQKLTDVIERYIRKYPAEWGWIHRRWKAKQS